MGHTLTEWIDKVEKIVRDETNKDVNTDQVEDVGLRPAFATYANDRPRTVVEETAGAGSSYLDLPSGWVDDFSRMAAIEFPARQNPPVLLDDQAWQLVRSTADVAVEQVLLLHDTPTASQHVRFHFTATWPFPTATGADDLIGDVAFEAVSALAGSYLCSHLATEAARDRAGALATDFMDGGGRAGTLMDASKTLYARYANQLGISPDGRDGGRVAVSRRFDYDPSHHTIFHGGRR